MDNYNYDGQFAGKILIAGRASCGKTTFIQKSATNNFFGELKSVEWHSYLKIDKVREAQIESCIKCPIDFHYPKNLAEFDYLTEEFKVRSKASEVTIDDEDNNSSNFCGENKKRYPLIVMGDVSGLADRSEKFSSLLTVARKNLDIIVSIFFT